MRRAEPVLLDAPDPVVDETTREGDRGGAPSRFWPVAIALAAIACVWVALFTVRLHAHQANVDDFLYASLSRDILDARNWLSAVLTTGQNSPLVPVLAGPGVAAGGLYGAMSIELPWLLVLCFGTYLLARTWVSEAASSVIMLVVGLNAAVLAYAVMLNFALASSACCVWCFTSYVRSERMNRWGWSAGLGVAFAALTLSRSVAPVYAVPLAVVIALDALWAWRRRHIVVGYPVLVTIGLVVLLAGPWWIQSGYTAVHYLVNAGYQPSSGFTDHGLAVSPSALVSRTRWELLNLGWIQSIALGVALLLSLGAWLWHRRQVTYPLLWMLWAWSALTLLILASSSNLGTAFGLPIIVVLVVGCGVVLGRSLRHHRLLTAALVLVLVAASSAGQFTASRSVWWPGPPYRGQVLGAGGTTRTNVDALATSVGDAIGGRRTVLTVENGVLNKNGISWANPRANVASPIGADATGMAIRALTGASQLITGRADFAYGTPVNQVAIESAAARLGFQPVRQWVASPSNNVVLWRKGAPPHALPGLNPQVQIVRPAAGSLVRGPTYLVAKASGPIGIETVTFDITRGPSGYHVEAPAKPTLFGWIAGWVPGPAPPGRYVITCTVSDSLGATEQRAITVTLQGAP